MVQPAAQVAAHLHQQPQAQRSLGTRLIVLLSLYALVGVIATCVLAYAAGGCEAQLIQSTGLGFLAAALQCTTAAGWRRLRVPRRLHALPSVLLAALQSECMGIALAHQTWQHKCSPLPGGLIAAFVAAPILSGIASIWLVLAERPHWLALHAMRATTGAAAMAHFASFYGPFTTEELPWLIAALIFGCLLGLVLWSDVWDAVRLLFPAALRPFADTLAREGLVADSDAVLAALPNNDGLMILVATVMVTFELAMLWLVRKLKP